VSFDRLRVLRERGREREFYLVWSWWDGKWIKYYGGGSSSGGKKDGGWHGREGNSSSNSYSRRIIHKL
jgi:hypothetical protein